MFSAKAGEITDIAMSVASVALITVLKTTFCCNFAVCCFFLGSVDTSSKDIIFCGVGEE